MFSNFIKAVPDVLCKCKGALGVSVPSPTLPTSSTVTTFVPPSNKFRISAVPL